MTALLASIAGISLLVGGVGIMNIMLVSVTERTREIGIRMSHRTRGRDIMIQFLIESVVLSCFGGAIGLAVGIALLLVLRSFDQFDQQWGRLARGCFHSGGHRRDGLRRRCRVWDHLWSLPRMACQSPRSYRRAAIRVTVWHDPIRASTALCRREQL